MNKFKLGGLSLAAAAALSYPFIAKHEGVIFKTYFDPVNIPTACVGHTKTAKMGQTFTEEQCHFLFRMDYEESFRALERNYKGDAVLSPEEVISYTSFIFNAGAGNFASSTMLQKLNSGDRIGACHELKRWVYSKGKKLNGLVKRRAEEQQLCLKGARP